MLLRGFYFKLNDGIIGFMWLNIGKALLILPLIFLIHAATPACFAYAQSSSESLKVSYHDKLLSISAQNADIKNVLLKIAEKANIHVRFPATIKKKITFKRSDISLKQAMQNLLTGLNHAIIYTNKTGSGGTASSAEQAPTRISEVFIFSKSKMSSAALNAQRRISNRISAYERQIASLKNNLARTDASSSRAKRYSRRIDLIQKKIQRLERQLN